MENDNKSLLDAESERETSKEIEETSAEGTEVVETPVEESPEGTETDETHAETAGEGNTAETPAETEEEEDDKKRKKSKRKKGKKRRKKVKFYEITEENDIKYRGPLSYRHLRIAGWVFCVVAQIATVLTLVAKANPDGPQYGVARETLSSFGAMMMPLLLIATFATILNGSKSFKSMLTIYGGASVLFYVVFILAHERYIGNSVAAVLGTDHASAIQIIDSILTNSTATGYVAFNIFIDLFLCTLLAFFLLYTPKKVFVGKKLIWFRLMAALPILYEIASFTLKLLTAYGVIVLTPYLFPLLTTKPPMTFLVFVVISFYLKVRERIYRKKGGTHEQYEAFLKTNSNSWRFSKFTALVLFVAGIVDIIIYFILSLSMTLHGLDVLSSFGIEQQEEVIRGTVMYAVQVVEQVGVGSCGTLIFVAPFILLFSYTRRHKNPKIDTLLPLVAIAIIAILYLEGIYHFILKAGDKLQETLQNLFNGGGGGGGAAT